MNKIDKFQGKEITDAVEILALRAKFSSDITSRVAAIDDLVKIIKEKSKLLEKVLPSFNDEQTDGFK